MLQLSKYEFFSPTTFVLSRIYIKIIFLPCGAFLPYKETASWHKKAIEHNNWSCGKVRKLQLCRLPFATRLIILSWFFCFPFIIQTVKSKLNKNIELQKLSVGKFLVKRWKKIKQRSERNINFPNTGTPGGNWGLCDMKKEPNSFGFSKGLGIILTGNNVFFQ